LVCANELTAEKENRIKTRKDLKNRLRSLLENSEDKVKANLFITIDL
jgi:hypothetical protein